MDAHSYARAVGQNLRRIRQQKGMSLADVQERSGGKWKAAVVGAYERGDRNVTIGRLAELAAFYEVPITEILPNEGPVAPVAPESRRRVVLDIDSLERIPPEERDPLARFASAIQVQRGDYNGKVLTIREDDLLSLALLYDTTKEEVAGRLERWGLLADRR